MASTLYELEDGRVVNAFEFQKRYQISPDFVGSAGSQPATGGATITPPAGTTTPPPPPAGTTTPPPPPAGTGGATTPPPQVPQVPTIIPQVGGVKRKSEFFQEILSLGISIQPVVLPSGNMTFPGIDGEFKYQGKTEIVRVK